jgi:hypothetical protein
MLDTLRATVRQLEEAGIDAANARLGRYSIFQGVFGIHIRRLGLPRALTGGSTQYLAVPLFLAIHAELLLSSRLDRLTGMPPIEWDRYVVLDRHAVEGLCHFDKFNCLYCDWANGLGTLLESRVGQLARLRAADAGRPDGRLKAAYLANLAALPVHVGHLAAIYFVIHKSLGLAPASFLEQVRAAAPAQVDDPVERAFLRLNAAFARYLNEILSEIESQWCPLHHIRDGVYPGHHKHFVDAGQLRLMEKVLRRMGTLKGRVPVEGEPTRIAA